MTTQPIFIEVSHPIEPGMKTYPGLPEPQAEILLDYDTSAARYNHQSEFLIASLHLCGNTGTYVDSPCHRHRGGADLAGLPLTSLAHLPVVVVEAEGYRRRGIGPGLFRGLDLQHKAVLVHTGWSRHWRTEQYFGTPRGGTRFPHRGPTPRTPEPGPAAVRNRKFATPQTADVFSPRLVVRGRPIIA